MLVAFDKSGEDLRQYIEDVQSVTEGPRLILTCLRRTQQILAVCLPLVDVDTVYSAYSASRSRPALKRLKASKRAG